MKNKSDTPTLTPKAFSVLKWLKENEHGDDLTASGVQVWYGTNRTSWPVLMQLLRHCFVSQDSICRDHYTINESGKRFLEGRPPYVDATGKEHWTFTECLNASLERKPPMNKTKGSK